MRIFFIGKLSESSWANKTLVARVPEFGYGTRFWHLTCRHLKKWNISWWRLWLSTFPQKHAGCQSAQSQEQSLKICLNWTERWERDFLVNWTWRVLGNILLLKIILVHIIDDLWTIPVSHTLVNPQFLKD